MMYLRTPGCALLTQHCFRKRCAAVGFGEKMIVLALTLGNTTPQGSHSALKYLKTFQVSVNVDNVTCWFRNDA